MKFEGWCISAYARRVVGTRLHRDLRKTCPTPDLRHDLHQHLSQTWRAIQSRSWYLDYTTKVDRAISPVKHDAASAILARRL